MEEEHQGLVPGNNDPAYLEEAMKEKKGIEWIKARKEQIMARWNKEVFGGASTNLDPLMDKIALEVADLENDYNYIKDLNTYVAIRHQEIWDCLPTLQEMDTLIKGVEEYSADDQEYFSTRTKIKSVEALKKLRSAISHKMGTR